MTPVPRAIEPCGRCPLCGEPYYKAIYLGLPLKVCADERCGCVEGAGSYALLLVPISSDQGFALFLYDGPYYHALWTWMTL